MKLLREKERAAAEPWARYRYALTHGLCEGGIRITGSPAHIALSRRVAGEGMVLLENNGILPLSDGTAVALFGIGSLDYVKGGGGAGMVYSAYVRDIYEGFDEKAPHIRVFEPLREFYLAYGLPLIAEEHDDGWLIPEPQIPAELMDAAAKETDVAIVTIHRHSREAWDRVPEKGDFYLSHEEEKLIFDVTAAFSHTVVVLNVGGMMDLSFIKENPKIDAALLAWQAGMEGGLAIADILVGDINPSGRLVDTFARSFFDYPSADSFNASEDYVKYYEDIFVGYRYFETIPGARERVVYPFGYGLSYTEFSFSKPVARAVDERIEISLTVKNVGTRVGREVVEIYFSAPAGVIPKSAIELAAFGKTRPLAPGESEEMTLSFPIANMASYDDVGRLQASAYVLEGGRYRFFAGKSCRALDEADYAYTVDEKFVVTKQLSRLCAPKDLEKRLTADGSFEALPSFPTVAHKPTAVTNTAAAPASREPVPFLAVKQGKLSMDAFLAQATEDELITLLGGSPNRGMANTAGMGGGMERLGVPPMMTADGPAGVRIEPRTGIATTAFPCATLIASTWDPALMYEIGAVGAREAKENALPIWLTPALNIHRSPLCGRNFEYYSEDPLIAGKFAAAKVRGIQNQGIAATVKHFAANNKEHNRMECDSRVSERALREIYLRGFEIAVRESDPWILMTAYNRLNGVRSNQNYEAIEGILRGEWGFGGVVTSDWWALGDTVDTLLAGNDISMPVGHDDELRAGLRDGRITRGHLEASARRILEMILKFD